MPELAQGLKLVADFKIDCYEECFHDSKEFDLFGIHLRVLSLEKLIAAKRAAGRPKDLSVVPELEAILEHERNDSQTER
jgi:predicted nucleotidyltransferase